jgi:hypothetical protein
MDDLLYIAFLVAWVAFGIYKNSQKAKNKANTTKTVHTPEIQESGRPSVFEEILTGNKNVDDILDDFLKDRETPQNPSYQPEPIADEQVVFKQAFTKPKYSSTPNISKAFEEGQAQTKPVVSLSFENEQDTGLSNDFDLRTAVVYAAILDRPYK